MSVDPPTGSRGFLTHDTGAIADVQRHPDRGRDCVCRSALPRSADVGAAVKAADTVLFTMPNRLGATGCVRQSTTGEGDRD
jgi:hypothetical protein